MQKRNKKTWLGTELPIIQAPMAGVQDCQLAISVSNAGGLGSLPCAMLSIEKMTSEIKHIKETTSSPYNLNFFCHTMPNYDIEQQTVWQQTLTPYFKELDCDVDHSPQKASRLPFSSDIADAIEPFRPEFVSFHFGLPEKKLVDYIKSWGTKILSSATTLEEALWLETHGVDGIIAQGLEAGGHRGMFLSDDISTQMGLSALLPQIVHSVSVPVIAAGGISDSKGVEAALLLGAEAVQVGTTYLLCPEATTTALHCTAIKSSRSQHTALTNVFSGRPARGIVNRVMQELGYMSPLAPTFPYASIAMTQLRQLAEKRDLDAFSPLWCGQNTLGCQDISAADVTLRLAGKSPF
ncbi:NAD(P)H-dependent flavin oxidoreductase [Marinomonas algicola]|uniref:NAD(P)H-dependent flavin oxidoreductase n=1 Tax=Marinomonas algicola TaxID=2773454 RepID=UPI00174AAAFD|nr:nitronate monooxygenase [Marinomonas algicola]